MVVVDRLVQRVDAFQKRYSWAGFTMAVMRKFDDDHAGYLASLLAYYAFFSLFPLLLLLVTGLGIALQGDPEMQRRVLHSALIDFPIIGNQIQSNVHSLNKTGVGLIVGIVGTFLGARGVANTVQHAFNTVWAVPHTHRPGFPWNWLRSIGLLAVIGLGIGSAGFLSGVGGGFGVVGLEVRIGAIALAAVVNSLLFVLGFRLALAREVPTRCFLFSAIASALTWQALLALGGFFIDHNLRHASQVYGLFGLVLGLLTWLHLQAQITLYMVEIDVVRRQRLWPRGLAQPPLTAGDRRAYTQYVQSERRRPEQEVSVEFEDSGQPAPATPPSSTPPPSTSPSPSSPQPPPS
jgi:YihY family inner membrane protein